MLKRMTHEQDDSAFSGVSKDTVSATDGSSFGSSQS